MIFDNLRPEIIKKNKIPIIVQLSFVRILFLLFSPGKKN